MMTVARTMARFAVTFLLCVPSIWAQTDPNPLENHSAETNPDKRGTGTIETIYLAGTFQTDDALEIRYALHAVLPANTVVEYNRPQNALLVRTTPELMVVARRIVADLDRPKKTYRVTYTITEFDAGKRIGTQHFALIIVSGQRTTLKQGSKVPVATGTYKDGSASAQAQFTYLDVGMNIDASIEDSSTGLRLKSKVEQSSIADSSVIADVKEPIIRQSVIEGISLLSLGKPLVLGGIDVPGSTRHFDIEAVVEIVK